MRTVLIIGIIFIFASIFIIHTNKNDTVESPLLTINERFWTIQSIDTMKFSRDTARQKLSDPSFDTVIEQQIKDIAKTGVTHVAIATPYDEEFLPYLKRWVKAARRHNLKVWYRGNLSGWEEWFGYVRIDRNTHIEMIKNFILSHPELFEDGDIFVSCPECENGGPGDPRISGDTAGHRQFLIDEYNMVKGAFKKIDKDIIANYYSMNGDVARLIMDKNTTQALDGIVSIDHYVSSPEKLINDIHAYALQSGGKVVLGEWGAPIPDINGQMTEEQQADYIDKTFQKLLESNDIEAINYWVNRGGSTELWFGENMPKKGVATLKKYFIPKVVSGEITDRRGNRLTEITLSTIHKTILSKNGQFSLPILENEVITISKKDYVPILVNPSKFVLSHNKNIILEKQHPSIMDKLLDYLSQFYYES